MAFFDLNPTFTPLKTTFWLSYGVDSGLTMDWPWMTVVAHGVDHGVERVLNMVWHAVDQPAYLKTTLVNIRFYF